MTRQRTKSYPSHPQEAKSEVASQQPSTLREQASAYGELARQVYADCKKGVEAEQEMNARRNTSAE